MRRSSRRQFNLTNYFRTSQSFCTSRNNIISFFFHRLHFWSYWYSSFRCCFVFFLFFYLHRFGFCLYNRSCFYFSFIYFRFGSFYPRCHDFGFLLYNLWFFFFRFDDRSFDFGFFLLYYFLYDLSLYRCIMRNFSFLLGRLLFFRLVTTSIQGIKINFANHFHTTLMSRFLRLGRSDFFDRWDFYSILNQDFFWFLMFFKILISRRFFRRSGRRLLTTNFANNNLFSFIFQ
ncbi:hypothetical protein D3C86_1137320 [compost metagenome]